MTADTITLYYIFI